MHPDMDLAPDLPMPRLRETAAPARPHAERVEQGIALVMQRNMTPTDAARAVNVSLSHLQRTASERGITLSLYYSHQTSRPIAIPFGPKGFSKATVAWARENPDDPEAQLIRGILGELPGAPVDRAARGIG